MALKPCPECGTQISTTAPSCPQCGYRQKLKKKRRPILALFLLLIAVYFVYQAVNSVSGQNSQPPSSSATADISNPQRPATAMPDDEIAFIQIIREGSSAYDAGANDMAKGAARPARAAKLCALNHGTTVQNWVGSIDTLSSNSAGKGVLSVRLDPHLAFSTNNNDFSDSIGMQTLIDPGSPIFQTVTKMKVGEEVIFSGTMAFKNDDCFEEQSMTQAGAMQDPSFLFQFTDVRSAQ